MNCQVLTNRLNSLHNIFVYCIRMEELVKRIPIEIWIVIGSFFRNGNEFYSLKDVNSYFKSLIKNIELRDHKIFGHGKVIMKEDEVNFIYYYYDGRKSKFKHTLEKKHLPLEPRFNVTIESPVDNSKTMDFWILNGSLNNEEIIGIENQLHWGPHLISNEKKPFCLKGVGISLHQFPIFFNLIFKYSTIDLTNKKLGDVIIESDIYSKCIELMNFNKINH